MKLLVFILILTISVISHAKNKEYLITSHVPHVLSEIYPLVRIIKSEGRTLLVSIKKNRKIPTHLFKYFREVNEDEILNYLPTSISTMAINQNIERLIEDITAVEVEKIVSKISSFKNRKAGSKDNVAAADYIEAEMKKLNLVTSQDCFRRKTCNVYGKITGTTKPDEIVLIEAHLDSVGKVFAGADDNASGIAGLLLIAKKIVSINPERSFIFFATNGEEKGLLGAKHYVKELSKSGEINKIKFVINMDMIGYNKIDMKFDIETNKPFIKTAEWMASVAKTYTKLVPNIVTPAWGSDHVPFLQKDIPTVLTIEHWPTKTPCYHSKCDLPDHLTYDYAAEIIKLNIAASYLKSK
jgi:Zn-dependent M28 family amino/carboxypeptidase